MPRPPESTDVPRRPQIVDDIKSLDERVFDAVSTWRSPMLDATIPRLTDAASYSRLSFGIAGVLSVMGGPRGRRAAGEGLLAAGATSTASNALIERTSRRRSVEKPDDRETSASSPSAPALPSAHTASAAAFAGVVGHHVPALWVPLNGLAAAIGFSRVYSGVHYPRNVISGWILGKVIATVVIRLGNAVHARRLSTPIDGLRR